MILHWICLFSHIFYLRDYFFSHMWSFIHASNFILTCRPCGFIYHIAYYWLYFSSHLQFQCITCCLSHVITVSCLAQVLMWFSPKISNKCAFLYRKYGRRGSSFFKTVGCLQGFVPMSVPSYLTQGTFTCYLWKILYALTHTERREMREYVVNISILHAK